MYYGEEKKKTYKKHSKLSLFSLVLGIINFLILVYILIKISR